MGNSLIKQVHVFEGITNNFLKLLQVHTGRVAFRVQGDVVALNVRQGAKSNCNVVILPERPGKIEVNLRPINGVPTGDGTDNVPL